MDVARFVDENSFSAPALQGKRAGGGLQQKSGLGLGGSKQQGSTVRRALGDISNRTKGADQQLQSGKQQQKQKDGQQLREGGASCAPAAPKAVTLVERAVAGPEHADADFGSPERFGRSLDEQREQQVEAEIEAAVTSVLSLRGTLPEDCYAEKPQVRPQLQALLDADSFERELVPPASPESPAHASLASLLPDLDCRPDLCGSWSIDEGGDSVLEFP